VLVLGFDTVTLPVVIAERVTVFSDLNVPDHSICHLPLKHIQCKGNACF
jgi:hypothetical protein